ncbi:zinc c2h2 type domain-containing protein [Cyclospora cayetanensis]|uniref:Zinc c2h2 type domain-containing protein n=1 Tax=Cyclospora cayetanensis TaxID=88456 RepID=A0A1D3D6J4_9EIME|nr:zinc c2h2 type domain-containing protein [Cyclospora cayetanensis]
MASQGSARDSTPVSFPFSPSAPTFLYATNGRGPSEPEKSTEVGNCSSSSRIVRSKRSSDNSTTNRDNTEIYSEMGAEAVRDVCSSELKKRKEATPLLCTAESCNLAFRKKTSLERHILCHSDQEQTGTCGKAAARHQYYSTVNVEKDIEPKRGAHADRQSDTEAKTSVVASWAHAERGKGTHEETKCDVEEGREFPSGKDATNEETKLSTPLFLGRADHQPYAESNKSLPPSPGQPTAPFSCPHRDCGKVFTSLDTLYRHLRRAAQRKRDYACPVCDATFLVFSALVAHKRSAHSSKLHSCEQCGKAYTRAERLKAHIKAKHPHGDGSGDEGDAVVDGLGGFPCPQCSLCFSSKSNLRVHVRVKHLNERRFSCTECDMKFAYKSVLRRHIASIHGLRMSKNVSQPQSENQRKEGKGIQGSHESDAAEEKSVGSRDLDVVDGMSGRDAYKLCVYTNNTGGSQVGHVTKRCLEGKGCSKIGESAIVENSACMFMEGSPEKTAGDTGEEQEAAHAINVAYQTGQRFLVDAVSVDLMMLHKSPG